MTLRKLAILILLSAACCPSKAADGEVLRQDSLANVLIHDGRYEDAITRLNLAVSAMDENHPDSLYIQAFVKMGYCYDRLEQPMKSIEMTKMAIMLRDEVGMPDNLYLANLYDNLALAYHKLRRDAEARPWIEQALNITMRQKGASAAKIRQLSHAVQISKALEDLPRAITYEKLAIGLVERSKGKYSELHLEHLTTLRTLYHATGDSAAYTSVAQQIRQLRDDIEVGVLPPEEVELSTPLQCRRHNQDALLCCRWILGNYVNTNGMRQAVDFISRFYKHTPDVAIYMGKTESEWAKKLNSVYLMAYIAASCDYALRHPDDLRYSFAQYQYAIGRVLDYYEANRRITGTIPTLDGYLRQREHNPRKFSQVLADNFDAYCNMMRSKRPHDFEVEAPQIMQFGY